MSTVLAIEVSGQEAIMITARAVADSPIEILSHRRIPLQHLLQNGSVADLEALQSSDTGHEESPEPMPEQEAPIQATISDVGIDLGEIDEAVALISSSRVLYNANDLPFTDQKKIEQVAPLQVQDELPFEIDDFIVDSMVVGPGVADIEQHRVVSSLAPKDEVAEILRVLQTLGVDPRYITTRASALGALANLTKTDVSGLSAFVELGQQEVAVAILREGKPYLMRNFPLPANAHEATGPLELVIRDITCSLAQAEKETKLRLRSIHVIGSAEAVGRAQQIIGPLAKPLNLRELVVNQSQEVLPIDEIAWSLGLTATEVLRSQKSDYPVVNFRQGQYAYRRIWQELWAALKQELFYIATLVLLFIGYYSSLLYTNHHALSDVEERISLMLSQHLPGESVPFRAEESFLKSKVTDLEEQLRKMGSLSALSPLQSMKELALAIGPELDVTVESMEVASSRMTIKGTVADNQVFSKLSTALKARSERFCTVQPDSKGRTATGRVAFSAVISLCE